MTKPPTRRPSARTKALAAAALSALLAFAAVALMVQASRAEPPGNPSPLSANAADGQSRGTPVELEIRLDPGSSQLVGRMSLDPAAYDDVSLRRFSLDSSVAVERVTQAGEALGHQMTDGGTLALDAEPTGHDGPLVIEYRARLRDTADAGRRGAFLGAEGGFLPAGTGWYPALEEAEPHAFRIRLEVAGGQLGVAPGSLVDEEQSDDVYRAVYEHPSGRELAVATGPWVLGEQDAGPITVRTLFPKNLEAAFGETYRTRTADYVQRFTDEIGPYPHGTLTVASSPLPVGLAFSGFTLLGERVIPLPFIPDTSLGHEVLHMWWGTGVYVDRGDGNWSEGLTTFMADYQFKREAGEARDQRGQWLRDFAALPSSKDLAHAEFRGGNAGHLRIAGYHRGAMLWRMLEDWIGRDALLEGARALYEGHRFREAGWDDLIDAFDSATQEDLEPFFRQWVERKGAPSLSLHGLAVRDDDENGWLVQGSLRQQDGDQPWSLRVPLVVRAADGKSTHWVELTSAKTEFSLPVSSRPQAIAADPDWQLFRDLEPAESPAILRRAELDPETRVIALADANPAEVRPWLGQVATESQNKQGNLVVLGTPEAVTAWLEARDLPGSPADMETSLETDGRPHAWAIPDQRVVVLSGADRAQRQQLAVTLRHFSQYSYVIQGEGRRPETGLWKAPGIWENL